MIDPGLLVSPRMRKVRAYVVALCLTGLPGIVSAKACIYADSAHFPVKQCLDADERLDLGDDAMLHRYLRYPLRALRVDQGDGLVLSDDAAFRGRIWHVDRSMDANELAHLGIGRETAVVVWRPPRVCLFTAHDTRNATACLAPGAPVTSLKSAGEPAAWLSIPRMLSVKLFSENQGYGEHGTLTRRFTRLPQWNAGAEVPSIQVARTSLPCHTDCPIPTTDAYDLATLFGEHWAENAGAEPQALFVFPNTPGMDVMIEYGDAFRVRLRDGGPDPDTAGPQVPTMTLRRDDATRFVALAMAFRPNESYDLQLMRMDGAGQISGLFPIMTAPWPQAASEVLAIRNLSATRAAELTRVSLAAAPPSGKRHGRRPGCRDAATLAILSCPLGGPEVVAHGQASGQAPGLQTRLLHIDGAEPGMRSVMETNLRGNEAAAYTTLQQIFSHSRGAAAQLATARVCHVPIGSMQNQRMRRGITHWGECIARVMKIISLYETLYPDRWNFHAYKETIEHILSRGTTGLAHTGSAAEAEFVEAVLLQVGDTDTRLTDAIAAFHQANALRAYSLARQLDLERVAARPPAGTDDQADCQSMASTAMHRLALGLYRLDLAGYRPSQIHPRMNRDGDAVELDQPFDYELVSAHQTERLNAIRELMQRWAHEYLSAATLMDVDTAAYGPSLSSISPIAPPAAACPLNSPPLRQQILAAAGQSITMGIDEAAREAEDQVAFLVVDFQGQPVAVLAGTVPKDTTQEAEIRFVVSEPRSVLRPLEPHALRGAGSYALHTFLRHLQGQGITSVRAYATTEPSALIQRRAGFRIVNDP